MKRASLLARTLQSAFVVMGLIMGVAAHAPTTVDAQAVGLRQGGMDLHLFRPAIDSKGWFTLNGADILGANSFSFGLVLDLGYNMLPFQGFVNQADVQAANALRTSRLVELGITGTLHFNYGIGNLLVVGIQVPIQVFSGSNITVPGLYNDGGNRGLGFQGLGNIVLHGKIRILRPERDGIGLAAALQLEGLTGTSARFAGEPEFAMWPSVALEWRPARVVRFGLNAGVRIPFGAGATFPINGRTMPAAMNATAAMFATPPANQLTYGPLLTYGAGVSFRLAPAFDIGAEVYGTQVLSEFGTEGALSLEAIGGFKVFVDRNSYLVFGGGAGIPTSGFQAADARAMVGVILEPSIGDRDGDGIRDDIDQCVNDPEDYDDFSDDDGCPEPDNDRDGILDVDDNCPSIPEDRDGDADEDGCPEGNEGDRDADGILDEADQCPDDPEDRDQFEDEDGCPELDNDRDQILDTEDVCPNDPEDRDNWDDEDGCPDPDNDRDRILDRDDQCPNDPETYNGTNDQDGCPDSGIVVVTEEDVVILEKIQFETDSAQIQPASFPLLDQIAATLVNNADLSLIEVQGHADERATDDYNIRLTRDRAAAVVTALTERGVARERLRSAGYGERCPLNPRHNAEAWEANRRVEFKIIVRNGVPTNVDVACPAGRELMPQ